MRPVKSVKCTPWNQPGRQFFNVFSYSINPSIFPYLLSIMSILHHKTLQINWHLFLVNCFRGWGQAVPTPQAALPPPVLYRHENKNSKKGQLFVECICALFNLMLELIRPNMHNFRLIWAISYYPIINSKKRDTIFAYTNTEIHKMPYTKWIIDIICTKHLFQFHIYI